VESDPVDREAKVAPTLSQEIRTELKGLGESQQAILEKIGALVTAQAVMQNDLKRTALAVEETQRTLRGDNGDPGLVARVQNIEKAQESINRADLVGQVVKMESTLATLAQSQPDLAATVMGDKSTRGLGERVRDLETGMQAVAGDVKVMREEIYGKQDGQQKDPGILERIRSVESFVLSLKNWGRLIFGAIIADMALRIWPYVAQLFINKP
jgi:hypothetical protein